MTEANIGFDLLQGAGDGPPETFATVGTIIKSIKPPVLHKDVIESTHQGSIGKTRFPSSLQDVQAFTVTLDVVEASFSALEALWEAGTVGNWRIAFPDAGEIVYEFAAFVGDIAPAQADATSVDRLLYDVTFVASGVIDYSHS